MQPLQCDLQPPSIKVKSQSHTTLQGQVSIAHHPSRSSLNRIPPFKVNSQSRTTLQGQVSIAHHPSRSSLNRTPPQGQVSIAHHPSRSSLNRTPPFTPPFKVKCQSRTTLSQSRTTLQGQVSIAHHPSRSTLNRAPPFKVKSQSHTTLQDQVSTAHHPSRSSLNRAPPFKVKSQSHTTLHTTLQGQGQVSIAHHPFSIAHHPSRSSLNRTPPFKVKCQSRTTLHHFKTQNSICPYLGSIASQLPLMNTFQVELVTTLSSRHHTRAWELNVGLDEWTLTSSRIVHMKRQTSTTNWILNANDQQTLENMNQQLFAIF